jgi:DNA-binding NarL/FixJ family response regulator
MRHSKILVVDDHAVVRHGLRALLGAQPGWSVVGEAGSGREALQKVRELRPDVAVLDIALPELNGLDTTRLILDEAPQTKVLIFTMHNADEFIEHAVDAGARGYVLKSEASDEIVRGVAAVLDGRTFFTSAVSDLILQRLRHGKKKIHREETRAITLREREIIQLLAEGHSNKQVAGRLGLSVRTVENHRARIMQKLRLHSFSDLVRHAIRNNIIAP